MVVFGQRFMVDTVNNGRKVIACRSRNQHLLGACVDMCLRFGFRRIETRTFQNDIDIECFPWQIARVRFLVDRNIRTVHCDGIFIPKHLVSMVRAL